MCSNIQEDFICLKKKNITSHDLTLNHMNVLCVSSVF